MHHLFRNLKSVLACLWISFVFAYATIRMGFITSSWNQDFTLLGIAVVFASYITYGTVIFKTAAAVLIAAVLFIQYKYLHWRRHGIPALQPWFPMGNVWGVFRRTPALVLKELYDMGKGHKLIGIWLLFRPAILLRDPELIKQVLVKEFLNFHERGIYMNRKEDPLSAHIFSMSGPKWRNLRTKLTPAFTSGKMRAMVPQFVQVAKRFEQVLSPMAEFGQVVDVKELAAKFATDSTTLTAFGITTHSLTDHLDEFRRMGRRLFKPSFMTILRSLLPFMVPDLSELLGVVMTPREVTDFFMTAIHKIIEYREKDNVKRDDFMGILLELKNKGHLEEVDGFNLEGKGTEKDNSFTVGDVAAEAFVFFAAGFETAAVAINWAIYELARNPALQTKARNEIHSVLEKYNGEITYAAIHEMKYLDQIVDEALRMYAPAPLILRKSSAPYKVPGTNYVIPAGTQVHISVHGLQMDPDYFPDPDVFDPDRFSDEEKAKRNNFVYIPFGEGPRNCFGMRYSMIQKKVGLIAMLNKFEYSLAAESPLPVVFDPDSFVFAPVGGMKLRINLHHK